MVKPPADAVSVHGRKVCMAEQHTCESIWCSAPACPRSTATAGSHIACRSSRQMDGPAGSAVERRIRRSCFARACQIDTICKKLSRRSRPWQHQLSVAIDVSAMSMVMRGCICSMGRYMLYLDAVRLVENESVVRDGMDYTSRESATPSKAIKMYLLSSFTVPPPRDQPFSCFRWIDSKLESRRCQSPSPRPRVRDITYKIS